ncbi:hypothetical protein T4D_12236 [Trichinella pseudospiralis]|uniref:Uncharacterized protein n=1 Tax=Trichinella pseudospiralis TaxID=6337 RepID=A0A0V1FL64_TRIPS|nr:hypothetical protein T4D_9609 [Trichinella pseudospiralis]KRY86772.1 hypothetical protein T4D_4435 [Trichinella pseudospiralis]KRY86777.1 hypothetical protein T4D_12236 [Trichinella pseudospiralis]
MNLQHSEENGGLEHFYLPICGCYKSILCFKFHLTAIPMYRLAEIEEQLRTHVFRNLKNKPVCASIFTCTKTTDRWHHLTRYKVMDSEKLLISLRIQRKLYVTIYTATINCLPQTSLSHVNQEFPDHSIAQKVWGSLLPSYGALWLTHA